MFRFDCFSSARAGIWGLFIGLLALAAHGQQLRDSGIDPANLGKGDWVYSISDATNKLGGHINGVTNETSLMLFYKSQGIRYFVVKAGTGATLFNGCYGFPQFSTYLVNAAHANGLLIFGYSRSYGTNTTGEVAIANFVFNQGADGFVWDAEGEWESGALGTSGPSLAWAQCGTVRTNWPTKFLAHAPFPIISYHNTFPYKEFGYWCDAVMPQIYHAGWTNVERTASGGINWSDVNWALWQKSLIGSNNVVNGVTIWWTNAIKPLIPLENVYGPVGSSPCEGTASPLSDKDVMEFIDYVSADPNSVTTGGYKGANFWRADLHGAVQWTNIGAGTSGYFAGQVNNIVIDDANAHTVSSWTMVRTYYNGNFFGNGSNTDTNSFGTNYLTRPQGTGAGSVQFTPNIVVPGDYKVYQWHPSRAEASASVPFIMTCNGGPVTVYANQQTNAGNWSLLGKFNFLAGTSGNIRITDAIPESSSIVMADGLKLVFVSPTSPPAAPSGLNATPVSTTQISLTWTDNSTNATGFVISRSSNSGSSYTDIGSVPATLTNYNDGGLAPNTTYYYLVRATNYLGASANSGPAIATTQGNPAAPAITVQPQSQTNIAGQNTTFSVNATGYPAPAYQWWFNGTIIPGATLSTYTRTNVQVPDAGSYQVILTNTQGSVTSAPAVLTVNFALNLNSTGGGTVAKSPDQTGYSANTMVQLTATAITGYAFIGWSGDAGGLSNPLSFVVTTNASITANFVSTATDVIVDNSDPAASYTGSWQTGTSAVGRYGADYRFALTAAGGLSNAIYQPYLYNPGYYDIYLWYSQGGNRATNAPWSVLYQGGVTNVPVNQQINGGSWYRIAAALPFARGTNGAVILDNDTGYSGSVVIADAVRFLYVAPLPARPNITTQPRGQAALLGDSPSFTVTADSSAPLSYQWRFSGTNLTGQTSSTLNLSSIGSTDFGDYAVLVSNDGGSVLSDTATLTPALPPPVLSSSLTAAGFVLTIASQNGPSYTLEYKPALDDPQWQAVTNMPGTGGGLQLLDPAPTDPARFYRVHVQ